MSEDTKPFYYDPYRTCPKCNHKTPTNSAACWYCDWSIATDCRLDHKVANKPEISNDCFWEFDDGGFYKTGCGRAFEFIAHGLTENRFNYCPFCGGSIKEKVSDQ